MTILMAFLSICDMRSIVVVKCYAGDKKMCVCADY